MKPDKFIYCMLFFSLFWTWPCTKHNSFLLPTEELTNRDCVGYVISSCIVYERKRKDCTRSWTFQPKSSHLCLLL